jgi:hypothetical protein
MESKMNLKQSDNKIARDETENEINQIRKQISDLKLIEDIYLLAKFCHDAKNVLYGNSTDEMKICVYFFEKNILKKFIAKYTYQSSDGKKYDQEDNLYTQMHSSNGEFRTDDYLSEYARIASILEKKMDNGDAIHLHKSTTAEEFLKQIDPEYAIRYYHYNLNKSLDLNENIKKPKVKI